MENTTFYVRAYATSSAGTGYGNEVSFTTLAQSVTVTITEPQDNALVSGTVTIKATATSNAAKAADDSILAVNKVEFYVDDAKIAEDTGEPYETTWDTTTYADGDHTVKAVAYNAANQAFQDEITVQVGNTPPEIMLNRTHLNYGSIPQAGTTSNSPNFANLTTGPQTVLLNNIGGGILNWSVTKDADWLTCTPGSGTGPGVVTVSADPPGLSVGTYNATITIQDPNAANSPQTVPVALEVYGSGTTTIPFGYFETPIDGSTVKSSIPVTGWALDDIDIASVKIYRAPISGQKTGGLVYIGDAIMVDGARPDVEQQFPTYPKDYQAGWGYMMLTNFLPNQGNGTFTIYAKATDKEGNEVTLGSKTITCDNANAVKPFGAIDTPDQGGTASGSSFVNWGWALTPQPNTIPTDGSTINVWVDGVPLGSPVYNQYREDIATLFPGYNNSNGAAGYFYLDTANYLNGVHTIAWSAEDNAGNRDGIGSRYFTIVNTGSANTNRRGQMQHIDASIIQQLALSPGPVYVKKGYDTNASFEVVYPGHEGIISIQLREDQRVEIVLESNLLSDSAVFGYMIKGDRLQPLPIGSFMDTINGIFYWQPCAGFFGRYRFVFVEKTADGHFKKKLVNVVINSKY
ncbi:MAG: BACON domain-containing protein [Planctomycetes bacterium]|nr:BACON domain-containing protein [Planctomycetota bacterium]